ncbi:MAG: DeoR/GlpR transcriptional regulator [Clostridia bacterium]|nr:DeoR/GlpR transcriptional regulator [Clostridia bacterium]
MDNNERLEQILRELRKKKVTQVSELSRVCFVSPCTLRRDLIKLEQRGLIQRVYGKVILLENGDPDASCDAQRAEHLDGKLKIARLAARLVQDNSLVMLDSSSTVELMIPFLRDKRGLHIITNGLKTALACQTELPDASVYCTGGELQRSVCGFTGTAAIRMIESFRPDVLFFSATALSPGDGVMVISEECLYMKRCMLQACEKRVLLCDSRKIGQRGHRKLCPLSELDCLVTDKRPGEEWQRALADAGVDLICPDED